MMTNQKVLGALLIIFVMGASIYFVVSKFKQEVSSITQTSPSPTPQLDFTFNKSSSPEKTPTSQSIAGQAQSQAQAQQLPLETNKHLDHFPGTLKPEVLQNKKAVIQTAKGIIQLKIYPEATQTASNFIVLAANGFYDGLKFHRVESGFVIQGGDPNGDGSGGPGYQFADEPVTRDYKKGIVAMANAGPNTNGSQFFIMLSDHPELPKLYTIFGEVISGQDVVDKIAPGDVMQRVVIQNTQ